MKKIILSSILAVVITISACKKAAVTTSECGSTTSTYTTNVKSILDANCVTCHNGSNKSGGYDLSTYSHAKNAKDAIVGSVQHASGFAPMPQGGSKLDDASIKLINCWSQNGTPE
ncbi:MAG: c-type cytochrome [Flavobacteriales bacterium]